MSLLSFSPSQIVGSVLVFSSLSNVVYNTGAFKINTFYVDCSVPSKCKNISLGEEQQKCYARLDELASYKVNWNGNNAEPFPTELIDKCKNIITELRYQPEIYPTAIDAIQFEYRKDDGSYLEFEIYSDKANVFCINSEKKQITKTIPLDDVKKEVDAFYDGK